MRIRPRRAMMRHMKTLLGILVLGTCVCAGPAASAQDDTVNGYYDGMPRSTVDEGGTVHDYYNGMPTGQMDRDGTIRGYYDGMPQSTVGSDGTVRGYYDGMPEGSLDHE